LVETMMKRWRQLTAHGRRPTACGPDGYGAGKALEPSVVSRRPWANVPAHLTRPARPLPCPEPACGWLPQRWCRAGS